jgi:hypothetical protein
MSNKSYTTSKIHKGGVEITHSDKKAFYNAKYPKGVVVELTAPIVDSYGGSKPVGARLEVEYVDDAYQLHGHWLPPESGSIAIIIEEDSFKIVED